jgi:signal transduction histidine kinase
LEAVEGRAGLAAAFKVEGGGRLAPELEEGLYRIAQEALNNALKHSQAQSVTVRLCYAPQQRSVTLEIQDDGVGFDPDAALVQGGLGLSGMEERAARFGGRLTVTSSPGNGTCVEVEVYQ